MQRPTINVLVVFSTFAISANAVAEEVVREISWTELQGAGKLTAGEIVSDPVHGDVLKIENPQNQSAVFQVFSLEKPGIVKLQYAVSGNVRYENVQQVGQVPSHLEMWNYFANGGFFFSRTLAPSGPLGSIQGNSPWRAFRLPFYSNQESGPPTKIEGNVVFAGSGTIYLSPLRVIEFDGVSFGGMVSGVIGGLAGTFVVLIGVLIGILAAMGKGRRLALGLAVMTLAIGLVSTATGMVTVFQRQPFHIYFPLLLLGIISASIMGALLPILVRRYQQLELRRISASDLVASE